MVSIISFIVLLLVTYSYSAPIEKKHETSTTVLTTEKMKMEHGIPVNMKVMPTHDETTEVPTIHKVRSSEESHSEEMPTHDVTTEVPTIHKVRSFEESHSEEMPTHDVTYPSSTITDSSFPSPTKMSSKRTVEDFLMSTMETRTDFERRAIRPMETREEIDISTHVVYENQMETTKNVEPSSSFDSFSKFTGLLPETTPEPEKMEQSSEESTVETPKLAKPVPTIPVKMTETKFYTTTSMETPVVMEPHEKKELSQDQKRGIIEKA